MTEIAISARNIGKKFDIELAQKQLYGYQALRSAAPKKIANLIRGRRRKEEGFWALRNITFTIDNGEVVGIVGRNGAGKSTLLRILAGIIKPTVGFADIFGNVGSLLSMGAGFHPELTGRENIYLGGAMYGMRRDEVREHMNEIIAFSDLGAFIDIPVKRYSSGMFVRLGFSLAAHLDREILLIDEALSAGDDLFRTKSYARMKNVILEGRTVVLVSHQLRQIAELCSRVLWLDEGVIRAAGDPGRICSLYERSLRIDSSPSVHDVQSSDLKLTPVESPSASIGANGEPFGENVADDSARSQIELDPTTQDNEGAPTALDEPDKGNREISSQRAVSGAKAPAARTASNISAQESKPPNVRPGPRRVMTTFPRSGTHWLKLMISEVLGEPALETRLNGDEGSTNRDLEDALENEAQVRLIYDHFRYDVHGEILSPERYPDLRLVLLYRNPLDALISTYYKDSADGLIPDPSLGPLEYLRLRLRSPDAVSDHRSAIMQQIVEWKKADVCFEVKYEDLVASTDETLKEVLGYLEITFTDDAVREAISNNSFERLSGGRRPGEMDPDHHFRRGVPGEWENVFSDEERRILRRYFGDLLEFLGYSVP